MQLFYDEQISLNNQTHLIKHEESKHILRVLRKKIGDHIKITNGQGFLFETEIVGVKSKRCEVKLLENKFDKPPPYQLHIGIAPTKSADRFEFFLEKATEIGITEITPLLCDNSERKRLNLKRCDKILQSAMKQSQRLYLPKLNEMVTFQKFVDRDFSNSRNFIAHCEDENKYHIKRKLQDSKTFCALIGPEGDFSPQEIKLALQHTFQPISLGNKRLRTETAGLAVCHTIALQFCS